MAETVHSLFPAAEVAAWERAVEIGPGSGKYTVKVLDASAAVVHGYDVSKRFLEVCAERCADYIQDDRLSLHALHGVDPAELLKDIEQRGWKRQLDGFYSIDVMVHIDLQYLIVYWITAAASLRQGGHLVMTLNDVTRDQGFEKLLRDIEWTFPAQGRPLGSGKFEWLSPDIVQSLLPRLGFEIILFEPAGRDNHVVARMANPALADNAVEWISQA